MDWRQTLLGHARALGRPVHEHALGIGIDFEDGYDAFWVLPGEVTSTYPVPREGPASVDELLAQYDRIGRLRERAVHVVRHYLASLDIRVWLNRNGHWGLETDGGASTSIAVGARLTAAARDTNDVYACVEACIKNTWVRKVPSRKRIDRYLATEGPPDTTRLDSRSIESLQLFPSGIRTALGWMGLCKALDNPESFSSPETLKAAAAPTGPIGQAMLRLADRLPGVDASTDVMKPGHMSLKFEDDYDRFEIDSRSRSLAKRIRADGPERVGDQLADEFLALNAARTRVLRAVWQAAAERGWRKQVIGSGFFGIESTVHLGHTHREVMFNPAETLTEALRTKTPETVVRDLFAASPDFADACAAALAHPRPEAPAEPPDADLLPRDVPPAPPLVELDADRVARLDNFADGRLRELLAEDDVVWKYRKRDVYDPAVDTWATQADWVRVAERHIGPEWPRPMAILILLDAGDPRGDALARQYLQTGEPHHEVGPEEVEIAWRYRREYPDIARKWFVDGFDDVPFANDRAALGDPVALRYTSGEQSPADVNADTPPEVVRRLNMEQRERVHQAILAWARASHRWSPPDEQPLRTAHAMGWRDVADALPGNPYLLPTLLTIDRRPDQFDEPGMLSGAGFVLAWSRLSPSPFLARLVATAHETDLVELAREASRRSVALKPETAKNLESAFTITLAWHKELQAALAIAWKRCRGAGTA